MTALLDADLLVANAWVSRGCRPKRQPQARAASEHGTAMPKDQRPPAPSPASRSS